MKMKFLAILLVLFGFLLRVWRSEELAGFDFDGERAAFWIRDLILFHKISLIGQEISLGGIFIGPFFYFFLTPFYYFWKMDPVAASIGVSLVSIFTMILIYKVGTRLFGQKTGLLALFLYAVSFRLNYYDRTTAPSNLIMICSLTVLYILTGEITRFRGLLLGAVLGLTFSVHPTAVLLLPIVLTFFLWNKKKFSGKILITVLGLMLFIWPLIIFDLRHEFINIRGVMVTLDANVYPWFFKLIINIRTLFLILAQLIFPGVPEIWLAPIILLWGYWIKNYRWLIIWTLWLLLPLSLYRRGVPEYYFLPLFPIFLIYFSSCFLKLPRLILLLFLGLVFFVNLNSLQKYSNLTSLKIKKEIVNDILRDTGNKTFMVGYDIDLGQQTGFSYLFAWQGKIPIEIGINRYIIKRGYVQKMSLL